MVEQAARYLRQTEHRIGLQVNKVRELEAVGRLSDAWRAREMLAVMTETRDAVRLRLKVAQRCTATQERVATQMRTLSALFSGKRS